MSTNGVAGVGTVFRRWDGVSAWATVSEIISIGGPGGTRETIDVTSLDSSGGYREFIAGFRDAGTVSLAMIFARTEYEIMKDDFEDDDLQNYEIVLPDDESTSLEFEGLVTEIPLTIPADDKVTCDVVIKISGQVTINSGTSSGLT